MTLLAGTMAAPAAALEEAPLDRAQAIKRARDWAERGVPYSQKGYKGGYRRDCSGLISYAWDLPENITTWRIPLVAKRIGKGSLKPGDVLLNASGGRGGRHVVLFDKWANSKKTHYWGIEQTGARGIDKTVRRKLPYPYKFDKGLYKPYRYVGMDRYYKRLPKGDRQPVRGYDGRVVTRQRAAAEKRAAAAKAREIARIEAAKKAAEVQASEEASAQAAAEAVARRRARVAEERATERAKVARALESPGAAVRYVAVESAVIIVDTLVGSLGSEPSVRP